MFYPAVEEYVVQNRQRELAKDLELKRKLRNSLESKSDHGSHFLAEVGDQLRNLARIFIANTQTIPGLDETTQDCIVC